MLSVLEAVRIVRGFTQNNLAAASGVSQASISLLESGHQSLSSTSRDALARALEVAPAMLDSTGTAARLRHTLKDSVGARTSRRVVAEFSLAFLRLELLDVASPRTIHHDVDVDGPPRGRAKHLRQLWAMEPGPAHDIIGTLEEHGVMCIYRDLEGLRVNALAATSDDGRVVMFVDPRPDAEEMRWAIAHELGHLVLHKTASLDPEKQADEFAGEFLAPASELQTLRESGAESDDLHERSTMPASHFATHARRNGLLNVADYRRLRTQAPLPWKRDGLPGPRLIAERVRERVSTGETIDQIAASAFLSAEELSNDYLYRARD